MEGVRVVVAHKQVALVRGEKRPSVYGGVRRSDGGGPPFDREDRIRAVLVRIVRGRRRGRASLAGPPPEIPTRPGEVRSEEHTSELQSRFDLVCRLLLEKKKP